MCGIAGFVGEGDDRDLARMNDRLVHRGPDDGHVWIDRDSAVHFAHRRLSIIDIADGVQPMMTADAKFVVIYNGEIYNHAELRKELEREGHRFQTDHSDTEVLLHGYRQWGSDLPNRLNGMWAFAIYDRESKRVFISRDRFGQKPLYYSCQNGAFGFSSELSSLVEHCRIDASIANLSLKKYFAYGFIPAPNSLYANIFKLPAGHNLTLTINDLSYQVQQYWDYVAEPLDEIPADAEEQWCEELRSLLSLAVKRRLMSDVPLGVFLSGGVDSSAIAAFAATLNNGPVSTFAIGFDDASFDESNYAKTVADQYKTDHHIKQLAVADGRSHLPGIMASLDEPMGDSSLLPTSVLCGNARERVTVALGGDGGDELFAGYAPFRALSSAKKYASLIPGPIHASIRMLAEMLPASHAYMSNSFKIKRVLRGLSFPSRLWNPVWIGPLEPKEIDACFDEPTDLEEVYCEAIDYWDTCPQKNNVDRTMRFYIKMYLQDNTLVKVDRASMMSSLEVRSPFLDIDVVNFIRSIPHTFKYRGGETKWLLKKALEPLLPREILYRSKQGFAMPTGRWFKNGDLALDQTKLAGGQDGGFVRRLSNEHRAGSQDHRLFLWNQWVLDHFL